MYNTVKLLVSLKTMFIVPGKLSYIICMCNGRTVMFVDEKLKITFLTNFYIFTLIYSNSVNCEMNTTPIKKI